MIVFDFYKVQKNWVETYISVLYLLFFILSKLLKYQEIYLDSRLLRKYKNKGRKCEPEHSFNINSFTFGVSFS